MYHRQNPFKLIFYNTVFFKNVYWAGVYRLQIGEEKLRKINQLCDFSRINNFHCAKKELYFQIYLLYMCLTVRDPQRWPRDNPLSAKVGTKFRQQVAVAQFL
jgi:hypothetical protein